MKILVVEDNPETGRTWVQVLQLRGHEAELIGSLGKCLETLPPGYQPDRILVDTSMPRAFIAQVMTRFHRPAVGVTGGPPVNPGVLPPETPILQKPVEPAVVLALLETDE